MKGTRLLAGILIAAFSFEFALAGAGGAAELEKGISRGLSSELAKRELSLEECLALALEWHPSLKKVQGAIRGEEAALESLRVNDRVKVSATARAGYGGDYKESLNDGTYSQSASITASKTIFDSGQNRLRKEMQLESLFGTRENELYVQTSVAASARRAYFDLVLKVLNRDVEAEKLKNYEEHLEQAKGFYDVGVSAFIDVTKAEANAASARVSLLKAESDIDVAQEALRVAMGIPDLVEFTPVTKLLLPDPIAALEQLLETALEDRPDYQQALSHVRARELNVKSAARSNSVTASAQIGSSISDREGARTSNEYSFALSVNIPVYDAGATAASIESAMAQLDQANADLISLRNSLTYDVRSAAMSLTNARERARSAEASVRYAEENLELAQGRYEVGVGSALELSDAVSQLATSRYAYYQALYEAQSARASLDQAMGHLPEELREWQYRRENNAELDNLDNLDSLDNLDARDTRDIDHELEILLRELDERERKQA